MKISKETLSFFKDRANDPGGDIHYLITAKDAKAILEALGIVVRPDKAIKRLTDLVQTHGPMGIHWSVLTIEHPDAKDLLAYIKQLEENQ